MCRVHFAMPFVGSSYTFDRVSGTFWSMPCFSSSFTFAHLSSAYWQMRVSALAERLLVCRAQILCRVPALVVSLVCRAQLGFAVCRF